MSAMLCADSSVVMVPDFSRYASMPTSATVFPQGTSAICSVALPIISTVRWTFFTLRSSCPGENWCTGLDGLLERCEKYYAQGA